jgi:hypothetical protein
MRVLCDNCGATYKIPEQKLVKEVNKATCRKCGHRMLIRRAGAAAAPPVAPPPQPQNDGEHTQIRRPPPAASAGNEWEDDGPTRIARSPMDDHERPTIAMDEPPPIVAAPPPPMPPPETPAIRTPRAATPLPRPVTPAPVTPAPIAAVAPAPVAPAAPRTPIAATPPPVAAPAAPHAASPAAIAPAAAAPAMVAPTPVAAHPAFDPAGDLSWAVIGILVACAGIFLLAFNISASPTQRLIGLALALFGALLSLFVLFSGARGRRKASVVLSVMLAGLIGVGGAFGIQTVYTSLDGLGATIQAAASRPAARPATRTSAPADDAEEDDVLAALAVIEEVEVPDEEIEEPEPEPEPEVVAAAAPRSERRTRRDTPIRGSGTDVAPRSERRAAPERITPREVEPERIAEPEPEPEPAKPTMTRLPTSVVETMVRNNKRIKRCWMEEKQRSGNLPSRVDVKFNVQPSGAVSSARITTRKYQGTDFDVCLGAAFRSITFPPFDGEPLTLKYSFVL